MQQRQSFFQRLHTIDRRVAYVLLGLVMIVPLLIPFHLPMFVGPQAVGVYKTVEAVQEEKLVILAADYDTATMGENQPQIDAVMRHLMRRGKKFAIMAQIPIGPELAQKGAEKVAKELGREYGKDWVNWGFLTGGVPMLMSLCKDIPGLVKKDIRGTPIEEVPAMRGVKDIKDVSMVVDFTGSAIWLNYVLFIYGPHGTPIGVGCTAVVGPELFPYIDSGQLVGQLLGMKGAAEYENLNRHLAQGDKAMPPLSFAHFLIMALIIMGNIGYFGSRWVERKLRGEEGR